MGSILCLGKNDGENVKQSAGQVEAVKGRKGRTARKPGPRDRRTGGLMDHFIDCFRKPRVKGSPSSKALQLVEGAPEDRKARARVRYAVTVS